MYVIIEEMCKHESDRTLFVGDFNYPEIDWLKYESSHGSNHHTNLFLETIQENLLFQHVLKQTRFRVGQTPSLLDSVLAREELVDGLEYYAPVGLSDHSVLLFSVKLEASWTENREVVLHTKNYNRGNYARASEMLEQTDWSCLQNGSVEGAWQHFKEKVEDIYNDTIPKYNRKRKKNIFMTREAFKQKQKKDESFRKYQTSPTMANFTQYKRDRNQLRSLTRKLRISFESMLTKELKKDPKPFWRYCNSRVKSQAKVGKITRPDGTIAKETEEKVAELSAFFSSVFTEEDNELPTPEQVSTESIESLTITQDKVRSKLKGLSGSKTPGRDNIHPRSSKKQQIKFVCHSQHCSTDL